MASTATTEIKDYDGLVRWLKPLGREERLRVLRRTFLDQFFTPAQRLLVEWDRLMLEEAYPHPRRYLTAMLLAKDLDTCRDLLAGLPVDPVRLDRHELFIAKNRHLVRLDMTAIDELEGQAAA